MRIVLMTGLSFLFCGAFAAALTNDRLGRVWQAIHSAAWVATVTGGMVAIAAGLVLGWQWAAGS